MNEALITVHINKYIKMLVYIKAMATNHKALFRTLQLFFVVVCFIIYKT